MIFGANQPYFLPYIGYFQLIKNVDKFIIADDVKYSKGGWINRNRIIRDGKIHYLTIPLKKHLNNSKIKDIFINEDLEFLFRSVEAAYKFAPQYKKMFPLLKDILNYSDRRLNYFLLNSLQKTCDYLGITTPVFLNSERNDYTELRGEKRVIHLCKSMGADIYINAIGGQTLYCKENFAQEGITLKFIKTKLTPYKQMRTQEFVPALSILDVMMNVPRNDIREMLNHYYLI